MQVSGNHLVLNCVVCTFLHVYGSLYYNGTVCLPTATYCSMLSLELVFFGWLIHELQGLWGKRGYTLLL